VSIWKDSPSQGTLPWGLIKRERFLYYPLREDPLNRPLPITEERDLCCLQRHLVFRFHMVRDNQRNEENLSSPRRLLVGEVIVLTINIFRRDTRTPFLPTEALRNSCIREAGGVGGWAGGSSRSYPAL